ncbi:alpha-mannosidase [Leadbettera azotonutricia]|uniref:Alpha-D-mannosidase n=1 Tax=Leadbettera azotonutricia (strain ATCC BAA-888 / DSM 13862 / ZAS-9) TaxID=545695 RepID=F5YA34_LEAAZ|nr:glycoside hydrolase family 38 C-terminal domain-containing protein [Leadbettera azotonutricia]AEF81316.1 alpha-D-mannosidase [Leadbettera azotonutricia ZAS-9]
MLIPKVEQRITQYLHFLKQNRYRELAPLSFETFETDKSFRAPPDKESWKKIPSPYPYGKPWHLSWFRATFKTPAKNAYPLYLRVVPNADSLVFIDGKPVGAFNPVHKKIKVSADGKNHTLHIESYSGHYYPGCHPFQGQQVILTLGRSIDDYPNTFVGGALVERVEPIYGLYYDVKCLLELAQGLDNNSLRKARVLRGLYDALMTIHYSSTGKELDSEAANARKLIAPLLKAKNGSTAPEIHLIGHAHIDHAWLWHIGETERKAARTYMNMARFAEEYPEFVFIQTQPAQLEGVKNNYPDVFNAVKAAFKKGNWEPNGGMWVEADCNVTGGESLIRQFLVGKAANKEMLNYESDTLWLPDVFGYAAALPQILAGCRIKYFVTSKIGWNDTTRFPYDTFIWRGIDGSAVKTHYISSRAMGYNGRVSPKALTEIWGEIQHKEIQSGAINSVGEGDGGGGTARGDLEMARRLSNLEGAPKSSWGKVSNALDAIFGKEKEWPEWRGELYLELHRGTYTTQARTKRYNRKLEFALRNIEWLYSIVSQEGLAPYPKNELLKNWKVLLTNQFHDIIPGSSIGRVYAEAEAAYKKMEEELAVLAVSARKKILSKLGGGAAVFNDLSWERADPVTLDATALGKAAALKASGGVAASPNKRGAVKPSTGIYPLQRYKDLDGKEAAIFNPKLPSLGWAHFTALAAKEASAVEGLKLDSPFNYQEKTLRTPFYRVKFDKAGRIVSLFDIKAKRELVAQGGNFNGFVSAQDVPILWEAWDIDSDWTKYLEEETRLLSTEKVSDGPVCFILRRKYAIGEASALTQDTIFYSGERRIDFVTKVDWKEKRRLLKVGFNTAMDATQVRCEVQYGHLLRNTHKNLPHDRAKFEICAHKWISMEEEGGGLALLNDSKYGHDVSGGSMRLTLLRSPTAPDTEADIGEQRFTYSLVPFAGSFGDANIVRKGYELNDPAVVEVSDKAGTPVKSGAEYSFFTVDGKGVIAESVKLPEIDKKKTVVIRLYESLGGRARTALHFSRDIASAVAVDMLEDNPKKLRFAGRDLPLNFRGFEIKTLLVTFKHP